MTFSKTVYCLKHGHYAVLSDKKVTRSLGWEAALELIELPCAHAWCLPLSVLGENQEPKTQLLQGLMTLSHFALLFCPKQATDGGY